MDSKNNLKNGFDTLEELQKNYPIGKVISYTQRKFVIGVYLNQNDIEAYRKNYTDVKILNDYEVSYVIPSKPLITVKGYLFDGKHWFAMEETWDGWIHIEEEFLQTLEN